MKPEVDNGTLIILDVYQGENLGFAGHNLHICHFNVPLSRPFRRTENAFQFFAGVSSTGMLTVRTVEYQTLLKHTCG